MYRDLYRGRLIMCTGLTESELTHHGARGLLVMTNHGQQQPHSAHDAVDEHGNDHKEGEEAGTPLEVDPHNQDGH